MMKQSSVRALRASLRLQRLREGPTRAKREVGQRQGALATGGGGNKTKGATVLAGFKQRRIKGRNVAKKDEAKLT